jgi:3-oxoacyl-[acyl-carrier protein] reductase
VDLGFAGKVALVTGASRGLGRAVADLLASEGASIAIAARDPEALEAAAREVRARSGADVFSRPTDVTREDQVSALIERSESQVRQDRRLVANAGGPPASRFGTTGALRLEERHRFEPSLDHPSLSSGRARMKEQRSGRIVAVTSISVKQPVDSLILSNTARAGWSASRRTLSNELGPFGIGVNVVCPGYTRTDRLVELASRLSQQEGVPGIHLRALDESDPYGSSGRALGVRLRRRLSMLERASYVTGSSGRWSAVKGVF